METILHCSTGPQKMSMMTTVRVGPDSVGWRKSGVRGIHIHILGAPIFFSEPGPRLG